MNLRITWTLPNVSPRQRPIKHVLIEARVSEALPWGLVNTVPVGDPQELVIDNVDPGDWEYGATVVDEADERGDRVVKAISVPFDVPGVVQDFTLALE